MGALHYIKTLATITAEVNKAQNTDWLASDFQVSGAASKVRITISLGDAVKVKLVPNTGTAFYIKGGAAFVDTAVYTEELALDTTRTWNLQTDDAGGCDIQHCVVQELPT